MSISGFKIRALRLHHKMKSEECASKLDITTTYLSLIENGKHTPSRKVISKAARLFEVPPSYFLELSTPLREAIEVCSNLEDIEKLYLSSILLK
ncbi:helix-turn-helix transcriptional regulator [Photobacterium sp. BZF1]|uniref:helix-turn-helix domain-containing protein n=1 Tax=Photobacterium sp. BZF1 TaxID=1904457 RepID=UPI001653852F|nr:helix-turn-helix transcriptional regulator [Photobacterium sp. BZF1]MBC7003418.1 helix-turn-helix transcriptional regulator [Photobacterium sp. BZF1]